MSLKQEIETWVQALGHYDNNQFEEALRVFDNIADTSKILFNCGVIHATLGEHDKAVECYQRAIRLDQYFAVAYFQQGVSNFLVGDFEEATANFNDTLLYLRGNTYIDYEQLGLKFRLYSCEVLFNRGICYIYLQQEQAGMQDFGYAVKEKITPEHDVIDEAIRARAEGYSVFSIPVGIVYRPNEAKVKNLKTKDYLGKARLVASSDRNNTSTGFQGSERKQALAAELAAKDDRLPENISYAATNLVQRGLNSRGVREQSAPPTMNRNVFPPTPPPESEKPFSHSVNSSSGTTGRVASVRNPSANPPGQQRPSSDVQMSDSFLVQPPMITRANTSESLRRHSPLQNVISNRYQVSSPPQTERPRLGTMRSASESRGPAARRLYFDRGAPQRPPLFRETTPQRPFEPIREDNGYEDVYDMYQSPRSSNGVRNGGLKTTTSKARPAYINEEDEYTNDAYDGEFVGDDGVRFEMLGGVLNTQKSVQSGSLRGGARRHEVRSIRVKVHAKDDTRYMMIGPRIEYGDFEGKIREKFGIKSRLKIRMQDDGDMITMGDQDDLDMLLASAKSAARKEDSEMGKMEIWIQEI